VPHQNLLPPINNLPENRKRLTVPRNNWKYRKIVPKKRPRKKGIKKDEVGSSEMKPGKVPEVLEGKTLMTENNLEKAEIIISVVNQEKNLENLGEKNRKCGSVRK